MSGLRFARKTCQVCGNECLDTDPRCWACGGWLFATPTQDDPPEPTLAGAPVSDRTIAWARRLSVPGRWRPGAFAAMGLVLAGSVGFWAGRRMAGPAPVVPLEPPRAYTSQVLPPPASDLRVGSPPIVEIRPIPSPLGGVGGRTAFAPPARSPQRTGDESPPDHASPARAVQPTRPPAGAGPQRPAFRPAPAWQPPPAPLTVPPDSKMAVVRLRNDAPIPVDLHFDGFNGAPDGLVSIAPGGHFELPVGAGDYRLRLTGRNAVSSSTRAVFRRTRRYELVIQGKQPPGAEEVVLGLREPALESER